MKLLFKLNFICRS